MTETDTYLISRIGDELTAQNKKLYRIAEQLKAQTKLQEGILKQLYLLCQIMATPSDHLKTSFSRESDEAFLNTKLPTDTN